ncbi:MAG: hypothetical protein WKG01_10065, partial [Kofleriaceae bacterium]
LNVLDDLATPVHAEVDVDDDDAGLNQVGRGPGPEATPILMRVIKERLENIQKVREGFADRGDVWKLPAVIAASLAVSGHKPGTFEAALAAGYMSDADDDFTDTVLAVLSIGLSLALAIPTGGGSLVVTAASGAIVALDIVQIYRDVEKYELGVAAANTDFDKARAVSQEEPSLVWLGLSILLTVAGDVGEAASIFKGMAPIVNKALGGTIDDLARNGPDIIAGLRTARHSSSSPRMSISGCARWSSGDADRRSSRRRAIEGGRPGGRGHEAPAERHAEGGRHRGRARVPEAQWRTRGTVGTRSVSSVSITGWRMGPGAGAGTRPNRSVSCSARAVRRRSRSPVGLARKRSGPPSTRRHAGRSTRRRAASTTTTLEPAV